VGIHRGNSTRTLWVKSQPRYLDVRHTTRHVARTGRRLLKIG
jgi:hypothetical protein